MKRLGLYLSDLSMHDSSREQVLIGDRKSEALKQLIVSEHEKCQKLVAVMSEVRAELRHTETVLYQLLPKTIATELRMGISAVETCKVSFMYTF
jgi:guanylate cyclase, other